jgi:formylglycine-generating enzyme required for sulfatase activity
MHTIEQCRIPPGRYLIGDQSGDANRPDGETPVREVALAGFSVDATTVTNDDFARFVEAVGFVSEAETFGFSAVFHLAVAASDDEVMGPVDATPWWIGVRGADWRHPGGPRSDLDGLGDHPVVHVSWNDAMAYCRWAGRRLPTEVEWEAAARGGLIAKRFPWGDDLLDGERWRCNIWQGDFPFDNSAADGWVTTAPVRTFDPNGYGLWQPVGNVWEWCAERFDPQAYRRPVGAAITADQVGGDRVIRGGSYLCHDSYCSRYRCSARTGSAADASTANLGFRTVGQPADGS